MIHRFLDFELDESLFELRCGGEVVSTQARVFAFIAYLLRHRARIISKGELIRELWKSQVVTDAAISQVVMLARKALRDEGDSQRIIKTVRGRGFRFIAEVDGSVAAMREAQEKPAPTTNERAFPVPAPVADVVPVRVSDAPSAAPAPLLTVFPNRGPIAAVRGGLVGRASELAELTQRLAATREGRGGLVLLEGEPGIGKTSLASELSALASEHGLDVQWGRAWEEGGAPPFWPWIQVLRGLVATEGAARVLSFVERGAAELFTLLPELASHAGPPAIEADRMRAQFRLFDAMGSLLRKACGPAADSSRRPRLFVLDDLHAVDEASVQLLRFLAPDLAHGGLLIVGTFRDFELQRQPVLAQLATACAETQRMRLKSLTEADVERWLEGKLGRAPSQQLTRGLHEASGGNPLLLAELSRRFDRDHPERLDELRALANEPLPERILRAVRTHLIELPEATHAVLTAASALGRDFQASVLAKLRNCSEAELFEQLAPALQRGVVHQGTSHDRWVFSHAMVCQAVYAGIPTSARLELHREIAELLERLHSGPRAPLYEIAHHYTLAAASGCRPKALEYGRRAALRAYEMRAFEVAADLYDRCIALARADGLDYAETTWLLSAAGEAWYRVGQLELAVTRYTEAAEISRAEGDTERFTMAVLSAASVLRGVVLYDRSLHGQLRDALEMLPATDNPLRAGVLAANAICMRTAPFAERDAALTEAIGIARRLADDWTLQWLLNARHLALWGGLHPRELLATADEMIEIARKTGEIEVLLDGQVWRILDQSELGDFATARLHLAEYRLDVERSASPFHRYMLLTVDSLTAQVDGDFVRAREVSARAWQWGVRIREPLADAFYAVRTLFQQFDEGLVHGDPQRRSAPVIREPPACVPADYRPLWALPWAIQDKSLDAERCVAQLLSHEASGLVLDAVRRPLLCVAAQVCWILNDTAQAARLYPILLPSEGLHVALQAGVHLGPISYALGLLATLLSQLEAAFEHFERALVGSRSSPPWQARTRCAFGTALGRAPGQESRACEHLREAYAIASRLGMADLREESRLELERLVPSGGHSSDVRDRSSSSRA